MRQYLQPQLDLLYAAIQQQAEEDVLQAVRHLYPDLTLEQEQAIMSVYKSACRMAEQRVVEKSTKQGDK